MRVEDIAGDELRAVAVGLAVPPPPAEPDLVALARRERARRRRRTLAATGLVAAAVAAVVVLASQAGRPDATPGPTHPSGTTTPLSTGAAPTIPYVIGETLYLDDKPVPGTWWDVQSVAGRTVATRAVPPVGKPVLFDDQFQPTRLLEHAIGTARISVDGTKLAWVEEDRSSAHLVVLDLRTYGELGRLTVDPRLVAAGDGTGEHILWLGDDGTVVYGGSLGVRTWKPGRPPTPSAVGLQQVEGYPVDYADVAFSSDGKWAAWRSDRSGRTSGRPGTYDGVTFESRQNPDTRFTIALPAGIDVQSVVWESVTDVLLRYDDRPSATNLRFLRCSIEYRHCELVPTQADP